MATNIESNEERLSPSNFPAPRADQPEAASRGPAAWRVVLREHSVYFALAALVVFNLIVTPGFKNPFAARSLLFE
ncbi:MAG: hypothetical protein V4793_48530, partial [Paraburkholderia tropica]